MELPPPLVELQRQLARLEAERGVVVTLGDMAGAVRADPNRLRQVLLILLANALRHTPAGGQVRLAAPEGRAVRLRVSDTGCGISPEHLSHSFERFYRAEPARGRESGNAGLGLSIAQGLVETMGGQTGATSAPGQGTTIWLTLPRACLLGHGRSCSAARYSPDLVLLGRRVCPGSNGFPRPAAYAGGVPR